MKFLLFLAFVSMLLGHTIKEQSCSYDNALEDLVWLKQLQKEAAASMCQAEIREASYNDKVVFELRETDPHCNGINTVFLCDGSTLVTSADRFAYELYLGQAKGSKVLWAQ